MKKFISVMILILGVTTFAQTDGKELVTEEDATPRAKMEFDELLIKIMKEPDLAANLKRRPKSYAILSRAYFQLLNRHNPIFTSKGKDGEVSRNYIIGIAKAMADKSDGKSGFTVESIWKPYSKLVVAGHIRIDELKKINDLRQHNLEIESARKKEAQRAPNPKATPTRGTPGARK